MVLHTLIRAEQRRMIQTILYRWVVTRGEDLLWERLLKHVHERWPWLSTHFYLISGLRLLRKALKLQITLQRPPFRDPE